MLNNKHEKKIKIALVILVFSLLIFFSYLNSNIGTNNLTRIKSKNNTRGF